MRRLREISAFLLAAILLTVILLSASVEPARASYAFYVGKNLGADKAVLIGGTGEEVSSHWLVVEPRREHPQRGTIEVGVTDRATYPGELIRIPQARRTFKYISMNYSDFEGFPPPLTNGGLNEHQVAVRDVWSPSRQELLEHPEYEIATAREPMDAAQFNPQQSQPQTVAQRLFSGAAVLFVPEEAEGQLNDSRYTFWAAGKREQHVPTLDEPGVRDQVIEAYKRLEARPVAEARAEELAKMLNQKLSEGGISSIAEGIADMTVLGDGTSEDASDAKASDADASTNGSETDTSADAAAKETSDEAQEEGSPPSANDNADDQAGSGGEEGTAEEKAEAAGSDADSPGATGPGGDGAGATGSGSENESGESARDAGNADEAEANAEEPAETPDAGDEAEAETPVGEETGDGEESGSEVKDEPLSVIQSPPFTWYRQSSRGMQTNPFAPATLEFGVIPGIDGVNENFMKTIAETPVGEVTVVPNVDRSVYYVVHVKARNPADPNAPEAEAVRQQFMAENAPMSRVYSQMARSASSELHQQWLTGFMRKHGVDPEALEQG